MQVADSLLRSCIVPTVVQVDSTAILRVLDKGPPGQDAAACKAFREFWGDKAELRRFPVCPSCLLDLQNLPMSDGSTVISHQFRWIRLRQDVIMVVKNYPVYCWARAPACYASSRSQMSARRSFSAAHLDIRHPSGLSRRALMLVSEGSILCTFSLQP